MNLLLGSLIIVLTIVAWGSAVVLAGASRSAHVGALTERAVVAVAIAIFGTTYSFVIVNSEVARIISTESAVVLIRVSVVVLLCIPIGWFVAYATGRLDDL